MNNAIIKSVKDNDWYKIMKKLCQIMKLLITNLLFENNR